MKVVVPITLFLSAFALILLKSDPFKEGTMMRIGRTRSMRKRKRRRRKRRRRR